MVTIIRQIILMSVFLIALLAVVSSVYGQANDLTCESIGAQGLCLEITLKTTADGIRNTPSKYKFPDNVKVNDYLVLDKFRAVNTFDFNLSTKPSTHYLDVRPLSGHLVDEFPTDYGSMNIPIPPLKPGDEYRIMYKGMRFYEFMLNGVVIEQPDIYYNPMHTAFPRLYKEGEWLINEFLEGESGYTVVINSRFRSNLFKVHSNGEIRNLQNAKQMFWLNIGMFFIALVMLVVTIRVAKASGHKLDKISQHILETSDAQIKKQEAFERKKSTNLLKALLNELESNSVVINKLIKNKNKYFSPSPALPLNEFHFYVLDKVLSEYLIEDEKLAGNLYGIREAFSINNNLAQTVRMMSDVTRIIEGNKVLLNNAKEIKKVVESVIKKLVNI